jgi:tetratricopeptide (TPR) repeat protein
LSSRLWRETLILLPLLVPALLATEPPEYQEAMRYVQARHWSEALASLRPLLDRYGNNPKVLNLQGLALAGAGRIREACDTFQKALRLHPEFWPSLKNLAIVEWNGGLPGAAEHTEAALKTMPADPVLNAYGSLGAIARKDTKLASDRLNTSGDSLRVLPLELQFNLGVQLGESGLYPQSISVFEQMLRSGADSPSLRYNLALAQFRAERYQDLIKALETLMSQSPGSDSMNLLAQAYEKTGQKQKAADTFRDAIAKNPKDESNYLDLANLCVDAGLLDRGRAVIDAGLAQLPNSARLNFQAGLLRVLSRDFTGAEAAFQRSASLQPSSDLPAAAMQLEKIQQSSLDEAIAGLRAELQKKPESGMLWYLLGTALTHGATPHGSAEEREAAAAYKKAINVDPKLPWPYVELAKIYLAQKFVSPARALLEAAIRLDPDSRPAYYQLAIAYRELHEPERSEQMFAKVRELNAREHGSAAGTQSRADR